MLNAVLYQDYSIYFWLCTGGVLLAVEVVGANGYLLWSAVAAIITGFLVWLFPVGWQWQGVLFSSITIIVLFLWDKWFRLSKKENTESLLNKRNSQFIGRRFVLDSTLVNCSGRVRVNDSIWPVRANSNIECGIEVEVFAVDGITLLIREFNRVYTEDKEGSE
ncbi:NfeD family protein [Enterobacter cancerogenus]|nr:NfeD family protein [Salmonella enterica]ECH4042257.1 NfeD family protein [Salmonella enterica]